MLLLTLKCIKFRHK